ncbi:Aspergillopepsin-2 [Pseudocercospora fuligena]|uniref:Aspergillopepsin-2 n=1 Tax=Pseudocercospora fuligena TaxID=685502 RepID=A0A8H6RIE2_9PEZI|nr:Aspergillopepsin-2 [Pseudocercospora fuligena]
MKLLFTIVATILAGLALAAPTEYADNSRKPHHSPSWAGAVKHSKWVKYVEGTVKAPTVHAPEDGQEYMGAAWVGIDGSGKDKECGNLFQTGIDWRVRDGKTKYSAWSEWYPNPPEKFNIDISQGDSISMKVVAHTKTSGTAYIKNNSNGQEDSKRYHDIPYPICQRSADWIVEDPGNQVPFATFGAPVDFADMKMIHGDLSRGPEGASNYEMKQNGETLLKCDIEAEKRTGKMSCYGKN